MIVYFSNYKNAIIIGITFIQFSILENNLYRMIGGLMKSRKIMLTIASIAVLLNVGGCTVKQKDDTKQGKTIAASSTKDLKEDEETIKKNNWTT